MKISGHILKIAEGNIVKIFPEMQNIFNLGYSFDKISEEFIKLIPAKDRDIESLGAYFNKEMLEYIAGRKLEAIRFETYKSKQCKYAIYTSEPFKGCKTCGSVVVECKNEKQYPKKRNSKTCNSSCIYFEST